MKGKDRRLLTGLVTLGVFLWLAVAAPWVAPHDPYEIRLEEGLGRPSLVHPLGQDKLGRDVMSRIIYGARVSMWVGIVTVAVSLTVGTLLGFFAGYYGGIIEEIIMRIVDILLAFPGILLAIAMTSVLGPSVNNVILALCITGWVGYARLVRAQVLSVRSADYVQSARALGAGDMRICVKHILPNILAPLVVEATFGLAGAILAEAGLSFLGLGTQPPTPSWGTMLNEGRQFLLVAPHMTLAPGAAIMAAVVALNVLGDGLRDLLDVKGQAMEQRV